MRDRHVGSRRAAAATPPPVERRDSARVPLRIMVRDLALGGSFDEREGDVSLGGVYFLAAHPPAGTVLELRFLLPGEKEEVHAVGEVVHVSRALRGFGAHVRFFELDVETELAIARYLERVAP